MSREDAAQSLGLADVAVAAAAKADVITVEVMPSETQDARVFVGCDLIEAAVVRPWLLEIVDPKLADDPTFLSDELTVAAPQTLVVGQVSNIVDDTVKFSLPVEVAAAPGEIELKLASLPAWPWKFEWMSGWTADSVLSLTEKWFEARGVNVPIAPSKNLAANDQNEKSLSAVFLGGSLMSSSESFDGLLAAGPDVAGMVTNVFQEFLRELTEIGLRASDPA